MALFTGTDALLSKSGARSRVKIGSPFVSQAGLELLIGPFSSSSRWTDTEKRWLVGVHHGITEPAALRTILSIDRSQARLFTNGVALTAQTLSTSPTFHAKVVGVEQWRAGGHVLDGVLVSSANLTRAALGRTPSFTNFEAGAVVTGIDSIEQATWNIWWSNGWKLGVPLTEQLIGQYEILRERFLRENPAIIRLVDPPSGKVLSSAQTMWIEAGAMSGGSRNQVEFNKDLAAFFGPPSAISRRVAIRTGSRTWNDRPLTPKVTTFGVDIWRLSLPTAAAGGPRYAGQVICFERNPSSATYRLTVAPAGSATASMWRREASQYGYVGMTSGNRDYGLF